MSIRSVRAAMVVDPSVLGRPPSERAGWHSAIDHMNPLGNVAEFAGQAARFEPDRAEVLCLVETDDGSYGIGSTNLAPLVVPFVNDYLGPMLEGADPEPVEDLWQLMARSSAAHVGLGGVASRAISAVDLALWDLRGRTAGQPVHQLISPGPRRTLSCYGTGFDVDRLLDAGFAAVKVPCPWGPDRAASIAQLQMVLATARKAAGHDVDLMLDGWSIMDLDDAIAVARAVEPSGLRWFEDALHPNDIDGWAALRSEAMDLPLAAGERWYSVATFEQAARIGAVDVLQPDPLWVGGATPTIRIAELAEAHGCEVAVHCAANDAYGQHLALALQPDHRAELYVEAADPASWHHYRSTPGMAVPARGRLTVSDAPGFGIDLSPADVHRATQTS